MIVVFLMFFTLRMPDNIVFCNHTVQNMICKPSFVLSIDCYDNAECVGFYSRHNIKYSCTEESNYIKHSKISLTTTRLCFDIMKIKE